MTRFILVHMNDLLNAQTAIDPQQNITVSASAGTGKTYLLVTRIVRLLINGAKPGNILAVTFTRKAAGEMRDRLQQQLWELATTDESELIDKLKSISVGINDINLNNARALYERVLFSEQAIRISTFHAFCQELLQRFPMEADIPPGFELLESTALLQDQAWDTLFKEATEHPDSKLACALEYLFESCNGLNNCKDALTLGFLNQRGDWWAFTQRQNEPLQYAEDQLRKLLITIADPYADFIDRSIDQIKIFLTLLNKHPTATNLSFASQLDDSLNCDTNQAAFNHITPVFLTKDGTVRKRSHSKTLANKMGEDGATDFIKLHETLSERILQTQDYLLNQKALDTNLAWYLAGQHLLDHYQRIKREQRLLDFTDLEWKTYELLHQSDNALWVQYKLDQKIDHLLIDEFQDTNPTQWQLILPILQEIASHDSERSRSVFIVGDQKQSIYGFRRANPELQNSASDWLKTHLRANKVPLSASWRSSPAIINYLNHVFEQTSAGEQLSEFRTHSTHKKDLWGYVECMPLQTETGITPHETTPFRNPLLEPRSAYTETAHYLEGTLIADKIHALIKQNILIEHSGQTRPLNYGDIYLLFRNRSHINDYEQALADAAIPFIGSKRGDLLDSLEILDMEALLTFLTMPFNNLALAHILKSPIFNANDEELMLLASCKSSNNWFERLQQLVHANTAPATLEHAYKQLCQWQHNAEHLPTHDLLDLIYHQGNILARYSASTPFTERASVQANLIRFIEMSLEMDSGRYPSTIKFLARIKKLKQTEYSSTDSTDVGTAHTSVRLLTIHAAKGLEAPVIFLADTASLSKPKLSYKAITDWPTDHPQPKHFYLSTTQANTPKRLHDINNTLVAAETKETANLLYVALTRAQNILFISGSCKNEYAPEESWYHLLSSVFSNTTAEAITFTHNAPTIANTEATITSAKNNSRLLDHSIFEPLNKKHPVTSISDSSVVVNNHPQTNSNLNHDARERGILIHDYLSKFIDTDAVEDCSRLNSHLEISHDDKIINACKQEAWNVVHDSALQFLFDSKQYLEAYNESSIIYENDELEEVQGVIDRIVIFTNDIWIIDYKTEALASPQDAGIQAEAYRSQLEKYSSGIEKIWPHKKIICAAIFTATSTLHKFS